MFKKKQGIFDLTSSNAPACATLVGVQRWGQLGFINVEFETEEEKVKFCCGLGQLLSV